MAPTIIIAMWLGALDFYSFLFVFFRHDRIRRAYWLVAILAVISIFLTGRLQSATGYLAVAWPFDWVLASRESGLGRALVLGAFGPSSNRTPGGRRSPRSRPSSMPVTAPMC